MNRKSRQQLAGEIVAENIRRLREGRGWSRRQLVEECVRAGSDGVTLTEAAIVNIESGRRNRRLDVDELLVFALVFDVSPGALLMPRTHSPKDRIDIGDRTMSAEQAWAWLEGRGGPPRRRGEGTLKRVERDERWYLSRPVWRRSMEQQPLRRAVERLTWRVESALLTDDETRAGHIANAEAAVPIIAAELRQLTDER